MKKHILLLSFSIVGLATIAPAQNQDPFAADQAAEQNKVSTKKNKAASHSNDGHPKIISICYETFSLSLADAAALRRKEFSDALLYQKILDGIKAGTAKQETFAIVRARSGERVMNENITEKIYPTEFEPPKIPNQLGIALSPSPSEEQPNPPIEEEKLSKLTNSPSAFQASELISPACPAAFETRHTGLTIEVESTMRADDRILDIRIVPEHVFMASRRQWGQGEAMVEMPEFETSRIVAGITASAGKPSLLGTINRPPHSKIDTDAADKVWFAFITPTIVVIRP